MDIQDMIEKEKRRRQLEEEEKQRAKLKRQLTIFKKEREVYQRKTQNQLSKMGISLDILEREKEVEIGNHFAVATGGLVRDEATVKGLVNTTGVVKELLQEQLETNIQLDKQIAKVRQAEFRHKIETKKEVLEKDKFRVPNLATMNGRVEHANARYHEQRHRNIKLEETIDNAVITRNIFLKEEAKLNKQLDNLRKEIRQTMAEAGGFYEERDRSHNTRMKVQEHLAKVKESCVAEYVQLSTSLTEDKAIESFMRIKQQDLGEFIRKRRRQKRNQMKVMLKQKDEYCVIFDRIKEAVGKSDMQEITTDFINREQDNFSTFITIGELLEENQRLTANIRDVSSENVDKETHDLDTTDSMQHAVHVIQARTSLLKQKSSDCEKRKDKNQAVIEEFCHHVGTLLSTLQMDAKSCRFYKWDGLNATNIMAALTDIVEVVARDMQDFTMVELSTRATQFNKTQLSANEHMLLRRPSIQIEPHSFPRIHPISNSKPSTPSDTEIGKTHGIMTFDEVKDVVMKSMMGKEDMDKTRRKSKMKPKEEGKHKKEADGKDAKKEHDNKDKKPPAIH